MSLFGEFQSALAFVIGPVFALGLIIFIHELGHFAVGRWCGIKVETFSIGFGKELWARVDRNGTRWRVAAVPLGGYVKFYGDEDAASVTNSTAGMSDEERLVSFGAQPIWKRIAVFAAGPGANFILAILIFAGVGLYAGKTSVIPRITVVAEDGPAFAAGFQPGDVVISIDGRPMESWIDVQRVVSGSQGQELSFVVERAGKDVTLRVIPKTREIKTTFGMAKVAMIGLNGSNRPEDRVRQPLGIGESLALGAHETWFIIERSVSFLVGLVAGRETPDQLSGVIGSGYVAGKAAQVSFLTLLNLAAVLSVSIGFANLLPIPILDGGHIVFALIEALKGKPLGETSQMLAFKVGLVFIIGLGIFVTFNDLRKLLGG